MDIERVKRKWHTFHHIAVTAFILNDKGDKCLIVKRSPDETAFPGKWAFVGGKLERGEKLEDTLRREVKEEVGLEVEGKPEFFSDWTFIRPDDVNVVAICFKLRAKGEVKLEENSFTDYKWVGVDDLKGLNLISGMDKQIKEVLENGK
jgi:nucleoside triphosphatase